MEHEPDPDRTVARQAEAPDEPADHSHEHARPSTDGLDWVKDWEDLRQQWYRDRWIRLVAWIAILIYCVLVWMAVIWCVKQVF